jgi:hypothetical protein
MNIGFAPANGMAQAKAIVMAAGKTDAALQCCGITSG